MPRYTKIAMLLHWLVALLIIATFFLVTALFGLFLAAFFLAFVTAEDEGRAEHEMFKLLDGGAETIVVSMPAAIYSHHEEFNGSIRHAAEYIETWRKAHNDKPIKMIISPQLKKKREEVLTEGDGL